MMNILLIGSGGREHAFAWKLRQSPRLGKLFIAPGNAGTGLLGENVNIGITKFEQLADFARSHAIDLTIVGPDDPLAGGIVDIFEKNGLRIFGPSKATARLESSKSFAKEFMEEARIPTAKFESFTSCDAALEYVRSQAMPIVIKANGLARGKGVYICHTIDEAHAAIENIMIKNVHGNAGDEIVIEEFLEGPEISIHVLCDGEQYLLFPPSQDHKRALDSDNGKNTGGMGTVAPLPFVAPDMMRKIEEKIVRPTLDAMRARGTPFRGLLYPGIKITPMGPMVLEYNARFGDPETEVYMRLLKTDLIEILEASSDHRIHELKTTMIWEPGFAVNIVLASHGYPDAYETGLPITGLDEAEAMDGVVVFHAGTRLDPERGLVTNGGRVLGISAVGPTIDAAREIAYRACAKIHFKGVQYRSDIGAHSL